MKITIVGTGAMATLFAGFLARAGYNVTMLGSWQAAIKTINERGVTLITNNTPEIYPVQAATAITNIEAAIILVKSWQTGNVAQLLKKSLSQDGICVTLQNGLGNDIILKETLGDNRVIRGVTTYGATLIEPGIVKFGGTGKVIIENHSSSQFVIDLFKKSELNIEIANDIDRQILLKALVNSAINPITALLDIPNGTLLQLEETKKIMREIINEGVAIAATQGYVFNPDEILSITLDIAQKTKMNYSSMLQDIKRGAPTEIDAINGYLCKLAKEHHIPTPYNHLIWLLIKSMTKAHLEEEKE